jgi:hypothetical protein
MKHAHAVLYEAGCTSHAVYAGPLHADDSRLPNTKYVHAVLYEATVKILCSPSCWPSMC